MRIGYFGGREILYVSPEEREGLNYCAACKSWFDDYSEETVEESRGEFWGMPCSETMHYRYCPYCGEDYDEGEIFDEEDIVEDEDEEVTDE